MKQLRIRLAFLLAVLLVAGTTALSQFGGGVRYGAIQDGYMHDLFNGNYNNRLVSGYAMYWFRLKEKRIEFLPEIGYTHSFSNRQVESLLFKGMSAFSLQFNTNIFFLDFGNDCNCPTFSKQSNTINRGLFAEGSPGIELRRITVFDHNENGDPADRSFGKLFPKVYAGFGFDIGISEMVTITPTGGVGILFLSEWHALTDFLDDGSVLAPSPEFTTQFGIRALFRPDYRRRRR